MKVGVISYGVGNLGSLLRALEELDVSPVLIDRPETMGLADRLILPGVGNFADCARLLQDGGWIEALRQQVLDEKRPLLGICVGMQLLADASMEGADDTMPEGVPGLGFIPGRVRHLRDLGCTLRVPHVGWNGLGQIAAESPLFEGIPETTDFYFIHSYAFVPVAAEHAVATTEYQVPVTAAVQCGHIFGTQFHPEKSSRAGQRMLRNFVAGTLC